MADTSVLVNLAVVDRFALLGALSGYRFRVPEDVIAEVIRPVQRKRLERALLEGHLVSVRLTGVSLIDHYRRLRLGLGLGPGESACLALAHEEQWLVACDKERALRCEARRLLGEGRLLNTRGLFVLGVREGFWNTADADHAVKVLEDNRPRMRSRSFWELMRKVQSGG